MRHRSVVLASLASVGFAAALVGAEEGRATGRVAGLPERTGVQVRQKWEGRLFWNSGEGLGGFFGPLHSRVKAILVFEVDHIEDPAPLRERMMHDAASLPEDKKWEVFQFGAALFAMGPVPVYRITGRFQCTAEIQRCVLTSGGIQGTYQPPVTMTLPKDLAYRDYLSPEAIAREKARMRENVKSLKLKTSNDEMRAMDADTERRLRQDLAAMEGHTAGSYNGTFDVTSRDGTCGGLMALYGNEVEVDYGCENPLGERMQPETDDQNPAPLRVGGTGIQYGRLYLVRRR